MPRLIITNNPAREAGENINEIIKGHTGDTLCLLSGGSAIDIINYIHPGTECFHVDCVEKTVSGKKICSRDECRTIFMTGDERVSREANINNYLQIKTRYKDHEILSKLIETVPEVNESVNEFSYRMEKQIIEILLSLNNPKIIFVLGIGTDGHTAGIFPMEETTWRKIYQDDLTYVPVHLDSLKIDSRASFTPNWILSNADILIGYAVGESKREILTELNKTDKKLYERPAELFKLHKNVQLYTDVEIE